MVFVVLVLAVVAAIALWYFRTEPKRRERRSFRVLLVACKGDEDLMERLIFAEMQRDPAIGYSRAAGRALERLKRDQR